MAKKNESFFDSLLKKLTKATPIEEESSVKLDHDFDGIQELNNPLPPWWTAGFVITVLLSVFYIFYYMVQGKDSQYDEYRREEAKAEQFKKEHHIVDANSVTLLTDKQALAEGKDIFLKNCAACHVADGGGAIGPNLTDNAWLYGCDIKDVFKVITNGTSKGMPPWKALGADKIQKVGSYVLSLQGTKPAKPKAPQGQPCNKG